MTTPSSTRSRTSGSQPSGALPYATLLAFTRYVDRTGPEKASFVGGLRRQREAGGGFNPHGQLIKALKADITFRTNGSHLAEAARNVNPRWQRLYAVLTEGATRYLRSIGNADRTQTAPLAARGEPLSGSDERKRSSASGYWLTPTHDALAMLGDLPVKISAHFGLRYDDGKLEAVRLYFDEEPPTTEVITATLHLLDAYSEQILPHSEPVLVDVRRGTVHRRDGDAKNAGNVDRWLTGEAAGFAAMWGSGSMTA